jgi:hypothetical protein
MKTGRFAKRVIGAALSALALAAVCSAPVRAESEHSHGPASDKNLTAEQKAKNNALVKVVREVTERYKDVSVAQQDGYALNFGCVSGGESGAMGMHFVKGELVGDGEIDVNKPEIVIYEPTPGGLKLIGADYLVLAEAWNAKHSAPPELMGQLFHFFDAPNRFGLPPFYTLHVWAWTPSPTGTFVNWNTNVSCDAFSGQTP